MLSTDAVAQMWFQNELELRLEMLSSVVSSKFALVQKCHCCFGCHSLTTKDAQIQKEDFSCQPMHRHQVLCETRNVLGSWEVSNLWAVTHAGGSHATQKLTMNFHLHKWQVWEHWKQKHTSTNDCNSVNSNEHDKNKKKLWHRVHFLNVSLIFEKHISPKSKKILSTELFFTATFLNKNSKQKLHNLQRLGHSNKWIWMTKLSTSSLVKEKCVFVTTIPCKFLTKNACVRKFAFAWQEKWKN